MIGALGLLLGCAPAPAHCVPGESSACVGPAGCAGGQICRADGTFGACDCGRHDAGRAPSLPDAGPVRVDAGRDARDAGPLEVGSDGAVPASDAGPADCVPACGVSTCGPDGCGGSCGECADGWLCVNDGECRETTEWCRENAIADEHSYIRLRLTDGSEYAFEGPARFGYPSDWEFQLTPAAEAGGSISKFISAAAEYTSYGGTGPCHVPSTLSTNYLVVMQIWDRVTGPGTYRVATDVSMNHLSEIPNAHEGSWYVFGEGACTTTFDEFARRPGARVAGTITCSRFDDPNEYLVDVESLYVEFEFVWLAADPS